MSELLYAWLFFLPPVLFGIVIWLLYLIKKKKNISVKWIAFIIASWLLLCTIIFYEWYVYTNADQLVTSSGDSTTRSHIVSRIIGFCLIIFLFICAIKCIKSQILWRRLFTIIFFFLIGLIYYKNSQLIVFGSNGNRLYELHITNISDKYKSGCIGNMLEIPIDTALYKTELPDSWVSRIDKIEIKDNQIIFHRPEKGDYIIKQWFLFWKLDIENAYWNPNQKTK